MSKLPFMQLYVSDYLGDTMHLSCTQHGAYMLLLMAMWRADGTLPNDHKKLARICRVTPAKFNGIGAEVLPFFTESGAYISHSRLTKELQKATEKHAKRQQAGRKGGVAKSLKTHDAPPSNAVAKPKHLPETRNYIEKDIGKPISKKPVKSDLPKRVFKAWNAMAAKHGLSKVNLGVLNPNRARLVIQRLADCRGDEDLLFRAISHVPNNPHWIGANHDSTCWTAKFDFVFRSGQFQTVLEYDTYTPPNGEKDGQHQSRDIKEADRKNAAAFAALAQRRSKDANCGQGEPLKIDAGNRYARAGIKTRNRRANYFNG